MTVRLDGEIAVVTGASQGIGEAIARALAEAGARVAVTSRNADACGRIAAELGRGHAAVAMDVSRRESVERAAEEIVAQLGVPTVLVNNAGVNRVGPAETMRDEDWNLVLAVNLTGLFVCCQVFGSRMLASGRGSIVNVASITGVEVGMRGRAPYAASKAGVVGLTRVLGIEWAGRGVRVNAIAPGAVRTPMFESAVARGVLDEAEVVDRMPMGRLAAPEDVARAVLLLAAPESGFVTGQTLVVDGGYTAYGDPRPLPTNPS